MSALDLSIPNSPGSVAPVKTPPSSSSKRRAKLQSDLEAGAKMANGVGDEERRASGGYLGASSSGESEGDFAHHGAPLANERPLHGAQGGDLFSRTSSCVYDKAKARERGRSYIGPRLSARVTDDSTSEFYDISTSDVRSPEPPSTAPHTFNPRTAQLANRSCHATGGHTKDTTGALESPRAAWQPAPHAHGDSGAGWAVRPVSHEQARQRSPPGDTFARAQSASRSPKSPNMYVPKDNFARAQSSKELLPTASQQISPGQGSVTKSSAISPSRRVTLSRGGSRDSPRFSGLSRRTGGKSPIIAALTKGGGRSPLGKGHSDRSPKASEVLDSPARHAKAREKASEFAVRSLNECPFYEGMLKVESHGEQRVRQLLYSQAIWLPAYCVLKDGVVTCSKDKRHTQVVDAFDMSETRVMKSDRSAKSIDFFVSTGSGEALVEFQAKTDAEAATWIKLCGIARKWAENSKRVKMGLMPLSDAANRIVGVRKIIKRWQCKMLMDAYDKWVRLLDEKQKTHLPVLFKRTQSAEPKLRAAVSNSAPSLKVSTAARRSRTPDNKTRAAAAFIPGQARQIRVVNGRVEVEKAMTRAQLDKKMAEDKLKEEARRGEGAAQSKPDVFERLPSQTNRRAGMSQADKEENKVRSLEEMAEDVVNMVARFEKVHQGMCKQLEQIGM